MMLAGILARQDNEAAVPRILEAILSKIPSYYIGLVLRGDLNTDGYGQDYSTMIDILEKVENPNRKMNPAETLITRPGDKAEYDYILTFTKTPDG